MTQMTRWSQPQCSMTTHTTETPQHKVTASQAKRLLRKLPPTKGLSLFRLRDVMV